jgi:tocopherol cyclase
MKMFDKIYHPSRFQGNMRKNKYFEGWYFKAVSSDGKRAVAVIPGISLSDKKKSAFIQTIDGMTGETQYFEFPADEFSSAKDRFEVRIGNNVFSEKGISLDVVRKGKKVKGELSFRNVRPFPVTWSSPGIMGPFRFVPAMECYHGVVSMDHGLNGGLKMGRKYFDFTGGKGYIEKDWGRSFPSAWLWVQTNHFMTAGVSFMLSVARIPWIGSRFNGFICFLKVKDKLFRFATYTGASIRKAEQKGDEVLVEIGGSGLVLSVLVRLTKCGLLKAPVEGRMDRRIGECIRSEADIELHDHQGRLLFRGTGKNAGMELVGGMIGLLNRK